MKRHLLYLGLDVHAGSITITMAEDGRGAKVCPYGKVVHDLHALAKILAKLGELVIRYDIHC